MGKGRNITVSAPAKIHLLGEHAVVYGKPALLAAVDLRVAVTISKGSNDHFLKKPIESIVKKHLQIKKLPQYQLSISSKIPLGAGLGSSAATAAAYIGALLTYLRVEWNLELINQLTYQAEKVWHGNPSGADNSTVVFGGLIWYRKETENLKLIQQLPFSVPHKLAKNFVLINTGTPKETTKNMVNKVLALYQKKPSLVNRFLENQEQLTKELLEALEQKNERKLMSIIKMGENQLESIGVVSKSVASIIREIESSHGAAKICGGGGKKGPTGILLYYHPTPSILQQIAKSYNLGYFKTTLGVEGLRNE